MYVPVEDMSHEYGTKLAPSFKLYPAMISVFGRIIPLAAKCNVLPSTSIPSITVCMRINVC